MVFEDLRFFLIAHAHVFFFLLPKIIYLSRVHLVLDVLHDMALHPSMMAGFQYAPSVGQNMEVSMCMV